MSNPQTRPPTRQTRQWRRPVIEDHIKSHPAPVASAIGAVAAIAFGLIATFSVIMAAWLIAAHGDESVNQVAAASAIAWLGLQLVPVAISGQVIGLLPWGFIALAIYLLWRSTQWSLKSADPKTAREYWSVAALLSGSYAVINGLLGLLASSDGLQVNPITVLVRTFSLALLVTVSCVLTYAPSKTVLIDRLPEKFRDGVKPGFVCFMAMILSGAVLCTISLVAHFQEMTAVAKVMAPQSFDAFFLLLLGIGYLPTAAVWSMSYLAGPGVVVGGTGVVSMYQTNPGALPAFPLLSVLPNTAPTWAHFLIAVPVVVGILLYLLLPREPWQTAGQTARSVFGQIIRPREFISLSAALSVVASCTFITTVAASGSLGNELLKFVGPKPLEVTVALTGILAITVGLLILIPRLLLASLYLWQHRNVNTQESTK